MATKRLDTDLDAQGSATVRNLANATTAGDAVSLQGSGAVPPGGTSGQVLTKSGNGSYALEWQTPSGGGGGVSPIMCWAI